MKGSKSDLFQRGHSTSFSSGRKRGAKNISLILYGLVVSCVFLLITGSNVWSFEEPQEIPSVQGKATDGSGSNPIPEYSARSTFHPFEIAQLSPGRVEIFKGGSEKTKESGLQFTANKLKQAGFILRETSQVGAIVKNFGNHEIFGISEIVYLDIGSEHGAKKGNLYTIFSKVRPILHPVIKGDRRRAISDNQRPFAQPYPNYFSHSGKMMGHMVRPLGYLEILESTAGSSKAIIRESYTAIKNGDFITPFEKSETPPSLPEAKGEEKLEGYVIAFRHEQFLAGLNQITYIDRGKKDGVIPGDRFEIFVTPTINDKKWYQFEATAGAPLIPHVIAELQVLDTRDETSTGVVISGVDAIPLGASVRYKPVDIVSPPIENVMALNDAPTYETPVEAPVETPLEEESFEEQPFADFDPGIFAEEEKMMAFTPSDDLKDIHFQFDKYDLDETSMQALLENAEFLKNNPAVHAQIQGHCDERGTNNYNLALGERRALAVKRFLTLHGIQENRLHLISYGEEKPFCHESGENCWRHNRRAHFLSSKTDLPVN